jgi:hypothetical protein
VVQVVLEVLGKIKMQNDRKEKIEKRIKWLVVELTQEGYLDGYSIIKYKEELNKLLIELETIRSKEND